MLHIFPMKELALLLNRLQGRYVYLVLMLVMSVVIVSCSPPEDSEELRSSQKSDDQTGEEQSDLNSTEAPAIITKDHPARILVLGDSLSAGHLLASKEEAYPHLTEVMLKAQGYNVTMDNRSVVELRAENGIVELEKYFAGESSNATHIFLALGVNNGLDLIQGTGSDEVDKTLFNINPLEIALHAMVGRSKKKGVEVMIAGVQLPKNSGTNISIDEQILNKFHNTFISVAQKHSIPLWSDILKGVTGQKNLIHDGDVYPNKQGHEVIAKNFYTFLTKQGSSN
ncbi:MAG: hypothetical protein OXC40_03445 [Proteobacteria bacterium]|nr:hypothetical protein [Pseudomonadota bacterium]